MRRSIIFILLLSFLVLGCVPATGSPDQVTSAPTPAPDRAVETQPSAPTPAQDAQGAQAPPGAYRRYPPSSLSNAGPWLIFYDEAAGQFAALNQDGTGLTALDLPQPTDRFGSVHPSPAQGRFAYISGSDSPDEPDLDLIVAELPQGAILDRIPLITPEWHDKALPAGYDNRGDFLLNVQRAITNPRSIAWSPDGRYLAYVAAIQGPSSDVYVYDTTDGSSRVLTTGSGQATGLSWSPDSEWIAHLAVEHFGTGAGWNVRGLWVVDRTGERIESLVEGGGQMLVEHWVGNDAFIASGWEIDYGDQDLWTVSIEEHDRIRFFNGPLIEFVFDAAGSVAAVFTDELGGSRYPLSLGVYVQPRYGGAPIEVIPGQAPLSLTYSQERDLFAAGLEDETVLFSRQGEIRQSLSAGGVADFSPDGAWLLLTGDGATLYSFESDELISLTDEPIRAHTWGRDSAGIFLFLDRSGEIIYLPISGGEVYLLGQIESPIFEQFIWVEG